MRPPTPPDPAPLAGPHEEPGPADLDLSIIAPAHNEEGNVRALVEETHAAVAPLGLRFELVIVDDASTDGTRGAVAALMPGRPWLRCVAMTGARESGGDAGSGGGGGGGGAKGPYGQSAAFHAGFRAARGRLIATLDADLQNDPRDLPAMLGLMRSDGADMVQGDRSHARRDNLVRRVGSIVGRAFRRGLLGDTIRDTGCSLRVMRREIALALPLEFRGMHRFIPVTARHLGFTVVEMPVTHRPRTAGVTKYGLGITKRAIPGLVDLLAVRYMRSRRRPVGHAEVAGPAAVGPASPSIHLVREQEVHA